MPLALEEYGRLSPSTHRALGFATAAARHRNGAHGAVEPDDLLVGLLLAHARGVGEVPALLGHFDLTLRDVLPETYPLLTAVDVQRSLAGVALDGPPPTTDETERILRAALSTSNDGAAHVRHVLGALIDGSTPLRDRLQSALARSGMNQSRLADAYREWIKEPLARTPSGGEQLRAWLESTLPRRPVDVPTYAADDPDATGDLIGIQEEADAFAYLLASKALRPPLAIGLFGEWGSGKSFFMGAIKRRVAEISEMATETGGPEPFWGEIRQIQFNAWEYAQSELWASLVHHIFKTLEGQPSRLVEERRADLDAEKAAAELDVDRLDDELESAKRAVKAAKAAVETSERRRDDAVKALREKRSAALSQALQTRAREALATAWDENADRVVGEDARNLVGALADARAELARTRGLLGHYWTFRRVLAATAVALVVPALVFALDLAGAPPASALLGGLLPLVPAVTAMLRSATAWSREQLAEIEAVSREIEAEFRSHVDAEAAKAERARETLANAVADRDRAELELQAVGDRVDRLRESIDALTPGTVLAEFLRDASRSEAYRRHLGLLSRVREDLRALESLMREHNQTRLAGKAWTGSGPAPPDRIILYIDDLDRCPPSKVIEVLAAVHLLLAFELFVVVVAVDSRWLSFALTDELHVLTTEENDDHRPTPQDYLEKIFQLPFWVQPLRPPGRRALVRRLMEGSVSINGPGGNGGGSIDRRLNVGEEETRVIDEMLARRGTATRLEGHALALLPSDLQFMDTLAPLMGDTPRRVKRFVNIVQLLLAIPPELEATGPPPTPREAVMFCAALNSGLPGLARALFEQASEASLGDAVNDAASHGDEATRLQRWLDANAAWKSVPLERLAVRIDLVRRLSFARPNLEELAS